MYDFVWSIVIKLIMRNFLQIAGNSKAMNRVDKLELERVLEKWHSTRYKRRDRSRHIPNVSQVWYSCAIARRICLCMVFVMFRNHDFMSCRTTTCSVNVFNGSENLCQTSAPSYWHGRLWIIVNHKFSTENNLADVGQFESAMCTGLELQIFKAGTWTLSHVVVLLPFDWEWSYIHKPFCITEKFN
jgi:hypothetical protein